MTTPVRSVVLARFALLVAISIFAVTIRVHADPPTTQTGNAASRRDSLLIAPQPWVGETIVRQELAPPARPAARDEQNPCPPSSEYTLDQITIECAERSGRFGYNLRLTGAGSGMRERWSPDSRRVERFRVPPQDVFELLRVAQGRAGAPEKVQP